MFTTVASAEVGVGKNVAGCTLLIVKDQPTKLVRGSSHAMGLGVRKRLSCKGANRAGSPETKAWPCIDTSKTVVPKSPFSVPRLATETVNSTEQPSANSSPSELALKLMEAPSNSKSMVELLG